MTSTPNEPTKQEPTGKEIGEAVLNTMLQNMDKKARSEVLFDLDLNDERTPVVQAARRGRASQRQWGSGQK